MLLVRATPSSRRNHVGGAHQGRLKIAVTQRAEKGKANLAISKLLANTLGIRVSQWQLVSGETSRQECFLVRGVTPHALHEVLAEFSNRAADR